ncbi:MAG TPA: pyridoxamine 5'-phosphate oxidase [Gammaproteobacteria bacterium]|nr:pyridoxamine 5'-phosphate oxidase [Gammaproteobacteria bacterium]
MSSPNRNLTGNGEALERFNTLWTEARKSEPWEADAMTLATVSRDGQPRARTVLLKRADGDGFVFYTNYESRKGADLAANPHAALCFFWRTLRRQVTVEGRVNRLPPAQSDDYFASRHRLSKLSAWASRQSRPLEGREILDERIKQVEEQYGEGDIPRPPHWGGYVLEPAMIEFWSPGEGRLNDRERYVRDADGAWQFELLYP